MGWHWRHRWRATSAQQMYVQTYRNPLFAANWDGSLIAAGAPTPVTVVLYRCDCGANETRRLDGHWTLNQVRGAQGD
jgi:hypothetical protein